MLCNFDNVVDVIKNVVYNFHNFKFNESRRQTNENECHRINVASY